MHLAFLVTIFRVTELHILALKNRPSCQIPCLSRNKHGVKLGDYYNAAIPRKFMTICKNVTFNVKLESKTRRILKCGGGFIICRGNMSVTVCIHSTLAVSPAATVFFPSWFYPVQRGRRPAWRRLFQVCCGPEGSSTYLGVLRIHPSHGAGPSVVVVA